MLSEEFIIRDDAFGVYALDGDCCRAFPLLLIPLLFSLSLPDLAGDRSKHHSF